MMMRTGPCGTDTLVCAPSRGRSPRAPFRVDGAQTRVSVPHKHAIRTFVLFCCAWALSFSVAAQRVELLNPGVPVKATIQTGETHCYLVRLRAGELAEVTLVQRGLDLEVSGDGLDVDVFTAFDKPAEFLALLADEARDVPVEVRPLRAYGKRPGSGEYELGVAIRTAEDRDRIDVEAQRTLWPAFNRTRDGNVEGLREAVAPLEKALALWRSIDDRRGTAVGLMALATALQALRENAAALRYRQELLVLQAELGWSRQLGLCNLSASWLYDAMGEYQKSLEHLQRADAILRAEPGLSMGHATVLASLGLAYASLGDPQKALDQYEKTLALYRKEKNRRGEGILLHDVGQVHAMTGDYDRALADLGQALSIHRETKNVRREPQTLAAIARVHGILGDRTKALPMFEEALKAARVTGDRRIEGAILVELADLHLRNGSTDEALRICRDALALQREIGDRPKEATALFVLARIERAAGRLDEARLAISECLALVESIRLSVEPRDLRLSFRAATADYYEAQIDILMALHEGAPKEEWAARAFEASERARGRALVEALHEVRSGIRAGIEPALLARERSVRARLTDKEQSRIHLLTSKSKPASIASIDRDIRALLGELNDVESDLRRSSPRYATLVAPQPLSLKDVQQNVLDENTALLEISLGETRSYLWAVTRDGLTVKTLPGRAEIEGLVRTAHTMATAQDKGLAAAAKRLRNLLFAPVAAAVKNRRVVIVPDGALHYLPFAAVIPEREIVVLPSATVLAMMRRTSNAKRPTGVVAVVADPVFRADDPRVEVATVTRSASSDSALPRLRFSRREAETVSGMVPGKKIVALDFDASRAVLRRVGDYRIVHFATHALVDDVHPQLSSLVLSTVDAKGREANGHVPLYEIYNLDLGSELVVLSACQTAMGKEMRGEGIVSLTHGFMYAGAPRVLSTLWRIDDRATAELMKHFYAGMLRDRLAPAAALHRAQRTLAKDERWSAPYYWAGFVLQGEWR